RPLGTVSPVRIRPPGPHARSGTVRVIDDQPLTHLVHDVLEDFGEVSLEIDFLYPVIAEFISEIKLADFLHAEPAGPPGVIGGAAVQLRMEILRFAQVQVNLRAVRIDMAEILDASQLRKNPDLLGSLPVSGGIA